MHISIFGLVLFVLSSWNCETMETLKICNFVHKASESCYNLNILSVGYKHSLPVLCHTFGYFPKGKLINK